jgi:hypothetical protein
MNMNHREESDEEGDIVKDAVKGTVIICQDVCNFGGASHSVKTSIPNVKKS